MKDFWQPGQVIDMMNEMPTVEANGVLALMMTSQCHWFFGRKRENHTTTEISQIGVLKILESKIMMIISS